MVVSCLYAFVKRNSDRRSTSGLTHRKESDKALDTIKAVRFTLRALHPRVPTAKLSDYIFA